MLGEQFGQGAMASLQRTYLGLKQAATYLTGDSAARQAVNDEIAKMEAQYGPALSTPAGKIGNVAGVAGQFILPGMAAGKVAQAVPGLVNAARAVTGAPGSIGRGAITAGAFEAAQPVQPGNTSTEDFLIQRGMKAAGGAAAGALAAALANKLTRPGVQPDARLAGVEQDAERVGLSGKAGLTPAQRTGDPTLLQKEEGLLALPGSSNLIRSRRNAQQDVLDTSVSKALGYPGRKPTEAIFGMARDNANLAYEPIAQLPKLHTDVPYFDDLSKFAKTTDADVAKSMATKIREKGSLSGGGFLEKLQDVRDMAFHASRQGDVHTARELGKVSNIMEDFLERRLTDLSKKPGNSITPDTVQQWKDARLQHSVIRQMEKVTDPVLGKVNPSKVLAKQFARQRPGSQPSPTSQALSEVTDISRVMRKTMPYIGSSGTAERLGGQAMVEAELNPLAAIRSAVPSIRNYFAAQRYLAHGGEPGVLAANLPPGVNAFVRRMIPPMTIGAGEGMTSGE